jgi:hypothetical protein
MTLKLTYAGFNYVADVDGSYADANSLAAMISSTNANAVALTDDYGIDPATSTIYADYSANGTTGNTETIANLTATIKAAEADGLSVMVRPLVDFTTDATPAMLKSSDGTQYVNGDWRAYYVPTNVTAFFNSYDTMMVAQAEAAQAGGAQMLDIGTELDQLAGSAYLSEWTKIINDVRAVFSGKLVYSAISDDDLSPWQYGGGQPPAGTGDITTQISFWSQLDYVGIDEYAAISDANNGGANPDPTEAQLVAGWENTPTDPTTYAMTGGLSLIQYYENVAATIGKPLLFTELGYESAPDAASQPAYTSSGTYDPTLQANLYQAFLTAWKADGNTSLQGVYLWNWEPNPATVGAGSGPNFTPQGNTGALTVLAQGFGAAAMCFLAGTAIATPAGEVPVEHLQPGDTVLNHRGQARTIVWIGTGQVSATRGAAAPVIVRKGALADQVPHRDLRVTKGHALYVDDVLIPVEYLINHRSILWDDGARDVQLYHIELETHDVLLANGAPAESYRDDGNRWLFQNARDGLGLPPRIPYAPVLTGGPVVDAVWARFLDRAGPRIVPLLTRDPDLHLAVGGHRLDAVRRRGQSYTFKLPDDAVSVRIRSRAAVPSELGVARDFRRLGVALRHIVVLRGARFQVIAAADTALGSGFHAYEPDNRYRWTNGDAGLDVPIGCGRELILEIADTAHYAGVRKAA